MQDPSLSSTYSLAKRILGGLVKYEQNSYLVSKKKKSMKGEVCNAMHKTTMESYLHLALALDP